MTCLEDREVMDAEIHSSEKNATWMLTNLPANEKLIGVKRVNRTKYKPNGEDDRFKVRLVAKGYKQKSSIDYFELFTLVATLAIIHMIIRLFKKNGKYIK